MTNELTNESDASVPHRPAKAFTQLRDHGDGVEFELRRGQRGGKLFLAICLTFWTVGCVPILKLLITDFDWSVLRVSIPFWIIEFVIIGLLLNSFISKERLRITSSGIERQEVSIFGNHTQQISYTQVQKVSIGNRIYDSRTSRKCYGLRIDTTSKPVFFALGTGGPQLDLQEAQWLKHELLLAIGIHSGNAEIDRIAQVQAAQDDDASNVLPSNVKTIGFEPTGPVKIDDEPTGVRLSRRAIFSWSTLIGFTLVMLFFNSILSVFIKALIFRSMPMVLRVFMGIVLIPFVLIGLGMIVACLYSLLAPLHSHVWLFSTDEIVRRTRFLGLPLWTRRVPGDQVMRIARERARLLPIRNKPANGSRAGHKQAQPQLEMEGGWQISVYGVGDAEKPALSLHYLDEGQSLAIASVLRRRLPRWFTDEPTPQETA